MCFIVPVGVVGINLGLDVFDCFNESLKFSGLGGCIVCLLVAVVCCMLCEDALVFDFIKG